MGLASPIPTSIQQIGKELAILWPDGREDYVSLERLRLECPCAMCRGEGDLLGRIHKPAARPLGLGALLARGWQKVGGYAIQIFWQDGHHDGIYTYELLRKLGEETQTA